MKKKQDRRAKLLVAIINKEDEAKYTATLNRCCTAIHFSGIGHGTARSSYRSYFGFNEIEKRIVYSIIPSTLEHTILDAVGRELRLYLLGRGIAFTMPLSAISNIVEDAVLSTPDRDLADSKSPVSKKEKTTMHELVIAVVNQKYTETAIEAARSAGATGATVFHTKSTNNARAEQSMGTALPEQTDSIFFLTTEEYKLKIMEAVRDYAGLKTEGGAVIFSIPVDDLVGIGRFDGLVDEE
jgi:nitrogen regulatory protein PII